MTCSTSNGKRRVTRACSPWTIRCARSAENRNRRKNSMRWHNLLLIVTLAPALALAEPNIEGYWDPEIGGTFSLTNPSRGGVGLQEDLGQTVQQKPSRVVDPPDGQIPYQPWARTKQQYIQSNIKSPVKPEFIDTQARCLPGGPIRATFWHTVHILQYPGYVVFEYEGSHLFRIVPLDGRPHLGASVKLWMGDSRGHWEGDTLVVDVTSYNGKSRLSNLGDFASGKAHIVERYTFLDSKTL